MKTGVELIAQERLEQIEKHGFSMESDRINNTDEQLILLIQYLLMDDTDAEKDNLYEYFEGCNYDMKFINKFDTKTKTERLIIAGALIAAQIDILNK